MKKKKMMCGILPSHFFADFELMFTNHFVDRWCGKNLTSFTLASISEVSCAFARWLLNRPIDDKAIESKAHNESLHA